MNIIISYIESSLSQWINPFRNIEKQKEKNWWENVGMA